MFYVNDKVKNKFDNDDYFDGEEYVKKIKEAIRNEDIKSIGVYGKWGIGKTSIIKNVINELIEEGVYQKNQIVEYNAWKYSEYDFMRDFLIICSNTIEGQRKAQEREESYYSDKSEDRQLYIMLWKKIGQFISNSWRVLLFIIFLYAIGVIGILWINSIQPNWFDCADLLTPLTLTLISFILPLFLVSEITHKSESKKFSPEQFARDFVEIVANKSVLIFIDDIDRCNYEEIKSTFDTLKTFILDEKNKVKFIIPVDPNILFNSLDDQTYDYFSKIIDFSVEIKNYNKVKFEPLKEEILENVDERYKHIAIDGLYLASKFYIDTPRKMKKFANEFINEIYNYSSEEINDKGYMFAKLIILKNEFPKYYNSLIRNYDAIRQLTNEEISNYNSNDGVENNKNGIIFNSKMLDFLSKTNNVDLYNFPMYEYKMTYAEYKIKAICENPVPKNKFEENIKIDLKDNIDTLSYEFKENIIKQIENNKFLYSDPIRRICFLVYEFSKQKNNSYFKKLYQQLMNQFSKIAEDTNLYINADREGTTIKYINIKYITENIQDYVLFLINQELDYQEDILINKILEIVHNNLDNTFNYCEDDLYNFTQLLTINRTIYCDKVINIIEKFLISNFDKYSSNYEWYFKYGFEHGKKCFVQSIYELAREKEDIDKTIYKEFLTKRYSNQNMNEYFEAIINNISNILLYPTKYDFLIEPIITNIESSDVDDEKIDKMIENTKLISTNEIINNFILSMIGKLRASKTYSRSNLNNIMIEIGKEYNATNPLRIELKNFVNKCELDEIKLILGYENEKNAFNNFNIFKNYEITFDDSNDEMFNIICNTYCLFEGYVIKSDFERHGIVLANHKEQIKTVIKENINYTIYLACDFNNDEIDLIDLKEMDINELKLEYIENNYLISKLANQLKNNINNYIKQIKDNKDNKEIIKEQVSSFLSDANKLYVDLNYSDKTLWTKLKIIDNYIALNELIDIYYIPELKKFEGIVNLFKTGKYKDNYSKDNIFADRIIAGIN